MKHPGKLIVAGLMVSFFLTGCGAFKENMEPLAPQTICTLRFWNGDRLLLLQDVERGSQPLDLLPEDVEGLRFLGWDRPLTAAWENADYYGIFAPKLERHVPYIFPREDGLLHPDDPFTAGDLAAALDALGEEAAKAYFPSLPQGEDALTAGQLWDTLDTFFPDTAGAVLSAYDAGYSLTRAEAAAIFNTLLGRQGESVTVSGELWGMPDLSPDHPLCEDVMEAAVAHESGSHSWTEVLLSAQWEPGWHIRDGKAMYLDSSGHLLKSTETEYGLLLDENGFQTSGSRELDAYVSDILSGFQAENPGASREELLKAAYYYVRDGFFYLRKDALDFGATGWELDAALEMFSTGKGNCYNYAAAFWALARGLGYPASAVSGTIGEARDPHGWAEIPIDGELWYFDPESEMVTHSWGDTDWTFYKLSQAAGSGLHYRSPRNT